MIIKFVEPYLNGYGYNTDTDEIVSFKFSECGKPLQRRSNYKLNGRSFYHYTLASKTVIQKPAGYGDRICYGRNTDGRTISRIMFKSVPDNDIMTEMLRYRTDIDIDSLRILDIDSGKIYKLKSVTTVTLVEA